MARLGGIIVFDKADEGKGPRPGCRRREGQTFGETLGKPGENPGKIRENQGKIRENQGKLGEILDFNGIC